MELIEYILKFCAAEIIPSLRIGKLGFRQKNPFSTAHRPTSLSFKGWTLISSYF